MYRASTEVCKCVCACLVSHILVVAGCRRYESIFECLVRLRHVPRDSLQLERFVKHLTIIILNAGPHLQLRGRRHEVESALKPELSLCSCVRSVVHEYHVRAALPRDDAAIHDLHATI
jgi:hypothetical protein